MYANSIWLIERNLVKGTWILAIPDLQFDNCLCLQNVLVEPHLVTFGQPWGDSLLVTGIVCECRPFTEKKANVLDRVRDRYHSGWSHHRSGDDNAAINVSRISTACFGVPVITGEVKNWRYAKEVLMAAGVLGTLPVGSIHSWCTRRVTLYWSLNHTSGVELISQRGVWNFGALIAAIQLWRRWITGLNKVSVCCVGDDFLLL